MNPKDERTWGTRIHLAGIIGSFVISSVGNILGALIVWLIKRNESSFLDENGKEALNFQITISIVSVALSILAAIQAGFWSLNSWIFSRNYFTFSTFSIFASLASLLWVVNLVFSIIAAVKASRGESYRYPISLRLVK